MSRSSDKNGIFHSKGIARYLILLIMLGAAVHIFLPRIDDLGNSIKILKSMPIWIVALAFISEVCSYLGSGYLIKSVMRLGNARFTTLRGIMLTLAIASISLVTGVWIATMATTYYWVSKDKNIPKESRMLGFLPLVFNNFFLVVLACFAFVHLYILHDLSNIQVMMFSLILIFYAFIAGTILLGIKYYSKFEVLILKIIKLVNKIIRRPTDADKIKAIMNELYKNLTLLRHKGWIKPAAGSLMNVTFDMLALYFMFMAAGQAINPVVLIVGYSMAFLLGISAFFIPGGVGIVESGMVAVYTSLGVPASASVVAVLCYRLLSFWIPSIAGFIVSGYWGINTRNL